MLGGPGNVLYLDLDHMDVYTKNSLKKKKIFIEVDI